MNDEDSFRIFKREFTKHWSSEFFNWVDDDVVIYDKDMTDFY